MEKKETFVLLCLLGGLLALLFIAVDMALPVTETVVGTVVSRSHQFESSSTGVGYSYGKGGGVPVVVSSSSPEKFLVLVNIDDEAVSCEIGSHLWLHCQENSRVRVARKRGRFTGKRIKSQIIHVD